MVLLDLMLLHMREDGVRVPSRNISATGPVRINGMKVQLWPPRMEEMISTAFHQLNLVSLHGLDHKLHDLGNR